MIEFCVINDEVARLEAMLAAPQDASPLSLLVALAWHMRQRDTARALQLAAEARAQCAAAVLPERERLSSQARLDLVEAEANWLRTRFDAAETLATRALATFTQLDDQAGCADAHWLRSLVNGDRGQQRDQELTLAAGHAAAAGDMLRTQILMAAHAYWNLYVDPAVAEEWWARSGIGDPELIHPAAASWAYDFLGLRAFLTSDFAASAEYRLRGFNNALMTGQLQRALILALNVGTCFGNLNDLQSTLEWMERGLDMARQAGWPNSIANGLVQTGAALRHLGRYDASQAMLFEARDILLERLGKSRTYVLALQYLGELALDRRDYAAALEAFRAMEDAIGTMQNRDVQMVAMRGQAHALIHSGQPDRARDIAQAALSLAHAHHDAYNEMECLNVLANVYLHHDLDPPGGITAPTPVLHYLLQARSVGESIAGHTVSASLLDAIAREYAKAGDAPKAYEVLLQANEAREKISSTTAMNRAVAVQIRHQTERAMAEANHHRELAASEAKRAEQLEQMSTILEHLGVIGQEITAHRDAGEVFRILDRHVHKLLDASSFVIALTVPDEDVLELAFGVELGKQLDSIRIPLSNPSSNIYRCIKERREIHSEFSPEEASAAKLPGTLATMSALFSPLVVGNNVLGLMTIQSPQIDAYGERERMIFRTLCAYGAIALDNAAAYQKLEAALKALGETKARLEEMSITDTLTGLHNRRYLLQHIEAEVAFAIRCHEGHEGHHEREGQSASRPAEGNIDLAFFMVDLDHFKSVNDTHGHAAGDAVLQQVARRLKEVFRTSDYVIRWGGEEFLIVARGTMRTETLALAERVRLAMSERPLVLPNGMELEKTCSIGVAHFPFFPDSPRAVPWDRVVELADHALYLAKKASRNAWICLHANRSTRLEHIPRYLNQGIDELVQEGELELAGNMFRAER